MGRNLESVEPGFQGRKYPRMASIPWLLQDTTQCSSRAHPLGMQKRGKWSQRRESNPWPAVYETAALPLSYAGFKCGPIRPHTPIIDRNVPFVNQVNPLGPTRLDILKGEAIISSNGPVTASPDWRHHGSDTCKYTSTLNGGDFCLGCRGRTGRHLHPRR